jgi:hypothetical protein
MTEKPEKQFATIEDKVFNRAEVALDGAWTEMEEFLKASKKPSTPEQREQFDAQFLEIQQRCIARSEVIAERIKSGDPAPHLSVEKPP